MYSALVWTSTKNECNAQNAIWSRAFGPSITRNLITRFLTICHVKRSQRTALEQKRFDLRSLSPALRNLWLLLVITLKFLCYLYSFDHRFKEILNFLKLYNSYSATAYALLDFTNIYETILNWRYSFSVQVQAVMKSYQQNTAVSEILKMTLKKTEGKNNNRLHCAKNCLAWHFT